MTIASLVALVLTNVLLAQSLRAKSILSTLTYVLIAELVQMFAPLEQSQQANNLSALVKLNSLNCRYLYVYKYGSFLMSIKSQTERQKSACCLIKGCWWSKNMVQVVSLRPSETMRSVRVKDNASDGGNNVTRTEETNLKVLLLFPCSFCYCYEQTFFEQLNHLKKCFCFVLSRG